MRREQVIKHDFERDGWDPFMVQPVSVDGTVNQTSVVAGRGRITGVGTGGNNRTWYLHRSALHFDSEVRSLWWGSDVWDSGGSGQTGQMGHVHRAQLGSDGYWRAVVVSNNIFGSEPDVINMNSWGTNGLALSQGAFLTQKTMPLRRSLVVWSITRINFGQWLDTYNVFPNHLYGLAVGDTVTAAVTDAAFNKTNVPVLAVDANTGRINLGSANSVAVPPTLSEGSITPTNARKQWPFWVCSRLIGSTLFVKAWRYMDPEPDWDITSNVGSVSLTSGALETPEANRWGYSGLVGAHLRNNHYIEYPEVEFAQLAA